MFFPKPKEHQSFPKLDAHPKLAWDLIVVHTKHSAIQSLCTEFRLQKHVMKVAKNVEIRVLLPKLAALKVYYNLVPLEERKLCGYQFRIGTGIQNRFSEKCHQSFGNNSKTLWKTKLVGSKIILVHEAMKSLRSEQIRKKIKNNRKFVKWTEMGIFGLLRSLRECSLPFQEMQSFPQKPFCLTRAVPCIICFQC